jgi:hypothetical protein
MNTQEKRYLLLKNTATPEQIAEWKVTTGNVFLESLMHVSVI